MSSANDILHVAICRAVGLLNVAPEIAGHSAGREVRNILRQALNAYPDVKRTAEPTVELRAVYEAARRVLRFNGVDRARTLAAVVQLDDAIEVVKNIDAGFGIDGYGDAEPTQPTEL